MSAINFGFDRAGWADIKQFDAWAAAAGFTMPATEHSKVWRKGEVELDRHPSLRIITFSTSYLGAETTAMIRLALDFWLHFGGNMQASIEIRIAIHRALFASSETQS